MNRRRYAWSAGALSILMAIGVACVYWTSGDSEADPPPALPAILDVPAVKGTLNLSWYGEEALSDSPAVHYLRLVNGVDYSGMEDNDLRGFLDGSFKYAWNQPGQSHVRLGRRPTSPRYGEHELFRVLQRWDEIPLPVLSTVVEASLLLRVERGPAFPVRVMLYEVKKDWQPGQGGTRGDNVSPPKPGEVWWVDRSFGEDPWGLPGVSYSSDTDPEADVGSMPLADTTYQQGHDRIAFRSERLARYITQRVRSGRPLLFLLKLSDYQEDISGSLLTVFSGNQGDTRNADRRPRLELHWKSELEIGSKSSTIALEYGRIHPLDRVDTVGAKIVAASFIPENGSYTPTIEMRGSRVGAEDSPWTRIHGLCSCGWDSIEVRITAATNLVDLGETFSSNLRDTWIRTRPPEEQVVEWLFRSPTGADHIVQADYRGDYTWRVVFHPDEIGPWQYRWHHDFTHTRYWSSVGRFDVLVRTRDSAREQLAAFLRSVQALDAGEKDARRQQLMTRFARLERACLALETPRSHRSRDGDELKRLFSEIRAEIGEPVPRVIPMIPDRGPEWARD